MNTTSIAQIKRIYEYEVQGLWRDMESRLLAGEYDTAIEQGESLHGRITLHPKVILDKPIDHGPGDPGDARFRWGPHTKRECAQFARQRAALRP